MDGFNVDTPFPVDLPRFRCRFDSDRPLHNSQQSRSARSRKVSNLGGHHGFAEVRSCGGSAIIADVASDGASEAAKGDVFVYRIERAGKTVYVGITNDLKRRARERGADLIRIAEGLSRGDAKGVEQTLLNLARKEGITLENKINSIATSNRNYSRSVAFGKKLLEDIGFSFKSPL